MEEHGADKLRYTGHCPKCKMVFTEQLRYEALAAADVLDPIRHSGCRHIICYRLKGMTQDER